ncbi:MAG: CSLREA domain-containing protein [Acidobacteriota bacterium]
MLGRYAVLLALIAVLWSSAPISGAILEVTTDVDMDAADGKCSLREAILAANLDATYQECDAGSGVDRIGFALELPATIVLTDSLPAITGPLRIDGPGRDLLTIDGDDQFRPFELDSPTDDALLVVRDLKLTNGRSSTSDFGGAVRIAPRESAIFRRVDFVANRAANGGGAVFVAATSGTTDLSTFVTFEDCYFLKNLAEGPSGGGAIQASTVSEVRLFDSTLAGNQAQAGAGGGLACQRCSAVIERSTLSSNIADQSGGGVFVLANSGIEVSLTLRHSTIFRNMAGDPINNGGGGLSLSGSQTTHLTLENTVVAENVDSTFPEDPDVACGSAVQLVATGFSFLGANDGCSSLFPAANPNGDDNYVGTVAVPLVPLLGDLVFDSGLAVPVHLPSLGPISPLLDQGDCRGERTDQRGFGNPVTGGRIVDLIPVSNAANGDGCDIGAIERSAEPMPAEIFSDGFESADLSAWTGIES